MELTRSRALALVLVAAVTVAIGAATVATSAQAESRCGQSVSHSFRTSSAISTWNDSQQVSSAEQNTAVTVNESTGFVRVTVSNPNGYCVAVDVELPTEIVESAELGAVDSVDESVTAEWSAIQNFSSGVEYTRIEATIPAGTTVEFAPTKARVVSLAWATDAKQTGSGIVDSITGLWQGDSGLKQRTYKIGGNAGNRKTIPLSSANTSSQVTDWIGEYRVDGGEWQPLGQDPEAAVYYTKPSDDAIQLHYNEPATVRWTANPTLTEKVGYQWDSYTAGWEGLSSLTEMIPF